MPFYSSLVEGLKYTTSLDFSQTVLEADLIQGGRGLDVPSLLNVFILLPMYKPLK
jgi:hypothetical protein